MKPTYQTETIQLYHDDCRNILPYLKSVDAIVTDPPFGIGFDYNGEKDVAQTPDAYWQWFSPIYNQMLAKLAPGGFVAVWQSKRYIKHFWKWYGNSIHIYCSAKNFVQVRKSMLFNYGFEPVVMLYKDGPPLRPQKPKRNIDFYVANTAGKVSDTTRIERQHPCPRPLDAVFEIVSNFTLPCGTVLDAFLGSGTTAIACLQSGRKCIGIEKDERFFNLCVERIEQYQKGNGNQLKLF